MPYRSTHNSVNSRVSLATTIKNNIELFLHSSSTSFLSNPVYQPSKPVQFSRIETDSSVNSKLAKRVMAKLMEGDATAAVRVVGSDDRAVPLTDDVLRVLQLKHPSSPQDLRPTPVPSPDTPSPAHATEKEIMLALRSFPASSSGGIDGLRPGHLKDLTSPATAEAGHHLRSAITDLINRFLLGDIPPFAREMFFSASLTALKKKDGGIRPIAVGNVFRRLAAKIACRREMQLLSDELRPVQLGVGVPGGCEAAVHAVRCFSSNTNSKNIIVKLDIKNAFNSIRRDHLLETCLKRTPSLFPLACLSYSSSTDLFIPDTSILSASGVQQGDPLGPMLFALAIDDAARSLQSPLNIWYLDDATLGGSPEVVAVDLEKISSTLRNLGLEINSNKSEVINVNLTSLEFNKAKRLIQDCLCQVQETPIENSSILGSPLSSTGIQHSLKSKLETLRTMIGRLQLLDSHPAFYLLKSCFSLPKLLFILRSAPCYLEHSILAEFTDTLRQGMASICNISFDNVSWAQATLPIKKGGIGLRLPEDVCLPAYISSLSSCRALVQDVLIHFPELPLDSPYDVAQQPWLDNGLTLPSNFSSQRLWDDISCQAKKDQLRCSLDQRQLACLETASQPHSGDWLSALPLPSTGSLLDNDTIRIGLSLRLGLRICKVHRCRCGGVVDEYGLHPLSCRRSADRFPRHYKT